MRNTVPVHDLGATKLQVRSVDLATEQLVDSLGTGKDDGLTLNLDGTLSETDKVSTDTWAKLVLGVESRAQIHTNRAASHQGDGENVLVSP